MSIKDRLAGKAANIGATPRQSADNAASTWPKTGAGQLMQSLPMLAEKDSEIAALKQEIIASRGNSSALEIPLPDLHEVPGRRRKLTTEQYAELRENLRNNALVSAITVRKRRDGGFEIISGHNRVAAFRELGKEKILAVVIDCDDAQTELSAFYANLLQSGLPDFEKYLGFKRRQKVSGKNQKELANEAGVTPAFVSMLMTFDNMPEEVLDLLTGQPELIGANAAEDFAKLVIQGRKQQVIEAITEIANGNLTQAAGLRLAAKEVERQVKVQSKKIRAGKLVFAELRGVDKTIRISFRSQEERMRAEDEIEDLIKQLAGQSKTDSR